MSAGGGAEHQPYVLQTDDHVDDDLAALAKCGDVRALMASLDVLGHPTGDLYLPCVRESLVKWTIRSRQPDVLAALIRRGASVERCYGTLTPLQCAAQVACARAAALLLDAGAEPAAVNSVAGVLTTSAVRMRSPLFIAIASNADDDAGVARCLLARAPHLADSCDWHSSLRALHEAVRCSNVAVVRLLLAARVDVNALEPDGATALHWAVRQRDAPLLTRLLLDAGASIDARATDAFTPLMRALHFDAMRLLLERGADVNYVARQRHNVCTVLRGDDDTLLARVSLLVRAGATLDSMTLRGVERLGFAANWGHSQTVVWLLACDVDPDGKAFVESRGLESALQRCRATDIAALLFAAGAPMAGKSAWRNVDEDEMNAALRDAHRLLVRVRFMLMRYRALEIAIALQSLRLPALLTTLILDESHAVAPKVPMHLKWRLATTVKHYVHKQSTKQLQ